MFLVSWQFLYATHICECFGFQECRAKLKRNMLSERFKIPKSEIVNQRTDNTIVKRNITNRQAMFHITRHQKLKIG